jgi:hypothetical protein
MEKIIYNVPVLGWMIKEAVHGGADTKVLFLINMVLIWLVAILTFGYPAIIIPALIAVPTMFTILILITAGK